MNKFNLRVSYRDTDQMGTVYYANYLVFFERGRSEFMREVGFTYRQMEELGLFFPVMHAECNYHSPAKYDDLLTIETTISELKNASVIFSYKIKCEDKLIATGSTKHPLVNKLFKPIRIPKDLKVLLEKHISQNE
ncbi:thioesterase family protein [Elusimicrobiota bacterium]